MKIYRMNTERFMNRVAESRGDVYLRLADGSLCDLKHDRLASALFRTMEMPEEGIELTFTEARMFPAYFSILQKPQDKTVWQAFAGAERNSCFRNGKPQTVHGCAGPDTADLNDSELIKKENRLWHTIMAHFV